MSGKGVFSKVYFPQISVPLRDVMPTVQSQRFLLHLHSVTQIVATELRTGIERNEPGISAQSSDAGLTWAVYMFWYSLLLNSMLLRQFSDFSFLSLVSLFSGSAKTGAAAASGGEFVAGPSR
jgi:hypothetical protein